MCLAVMRVSLERNTDKVLHFIQTYPGRHLRQIKNELDMSMGTLQYQLVQLEKMGRITSIRRGLYKFYFPSGIFQDNEKGILEILSQETSREILMFIIERKRPIQTDIVNSIGISAASVNWHIKHLIASRLIKEIRIGRYKKYQLQNEYKSKYIVDLLKNYYPGVWKNWSSRLAEMFLGLSNKNEENGK
jgi:predicted transcriptional regulator